MFSRLSIVLTLIVAVVNLTHAYPLPATLRAIAAHQRVMYPHPEPWCALVTPKSTSKSKRGDVLGTAITHSTGCTDPGDNVLETVVAWNPSGNCERCIFYEDDKCAKEIAKFKKGADGNISKSKVVRYHCE